MPDSFRTLEVPDALVEKYDRPGPRYTSYPTVPHWSDKFTETMQREVLERSHVPGLSLYFHVPFCRQRCLFCGCSVIVTSRRKTATAYVDALIEELRLVREAGPSLSRRPVRQIHWGGGTPTYLLDSDTRRLADAIRGTFSLEDDAEVSIEIDPRATSVEQLGLLRELGFNRVSIGVQDVEPTVQEAVGRVQPFEEIVELCSAARDLKMTSVNFDVIYGLPKQTRATLRASLERILDLGPDRLSLFSYAHVPWMRRHQTRMPEDAIPRGTEKFRMFQDSVAFLTERGYEYIGLDHFALPGDELAAERRAGRLQRNFQGYSTRRGLGLLGFGVTAISDLGTSYAQNRAKLADYYRAIEAGELATEKGYLLSEDDHLRRRLISDLMCHSRIDLEEVAPLIDEPVTERFADALALLEPMARDGLVELGENEIAVTPLGRLFIRNIAMTFDAHLGREEPRIYSRTV